ncbi:hypothetical protein PEC301899_30630 [Pectobacterium carotovorum subsp. carotovorum]|nr:hypothetical protein PEC301899_30630 [Pectobacterium carotovorum subsp. carotovorum]
MCLSEVQLRLNNQSPVFNGGDNGLSGVETVNC